MNSGQRKILVWTLWGVSCLAVFVAVSYSNDGSWEHTNPVPWIVGAIVFAGLGFFVRAGGSKPPKDEAEK